VSVWLSVTLVSPAKTADPIEILFGLRTGAQGIMYSFDGGPDHPKGRDSLEGVGEV